MNACREERCAQGRKSCPCPTACGWPDTPEDSGRWESVAICIGGCLVILFVLALILAPFLE